MTILSYKNNLFIHKYHDFLFQLIHYCCNNTCLSGRPRVKNTTFLTCEHINTCKQLNKLQGSVSISLFVI